MKSIFLGLLLIPALVKSEPVDLAPVSNMIAGGMPGLSLVGIAIASLLILLLIFALISTYLFGFVLGSGKSVFGERRPPSSSSLPMSGPSPGPPPPPGF